LPVAGDVDEDVGVFVLEVFCHDDLWAVPGVGMSRRTSGATKDEVEDTYGERGQSRKCESRSGVKTCS
jgi:hypothetical protein